MREEGKIEMMHFEVAWNKITSQGIPKDGKTR